MLVFITSLKHPSVTKSSSLVSALLDRTLRTIQKQTNKNFRVIVICHEVPKLAKKYSFVEYVVVDFPAPAEDFNSLVCGRSRDTVLREKRHDLARVDKGKKYLRGLYLAKKYKPSHVMFFDSDDCLSPNICQTVLSGPVKQSWVVSDGYIYCEGSSWIKKRHNFNDICGTCYVFSMSIFEELPQHEGEVPLVWYRDNLGSHTRVHSWLNSLNVRLCKIPYPAVVYIINHGENHAGLYSYNLLLYRSLNTFIGFTKFLLHLFRFRFLTSSLKNEFSLFPVVLK